MKRKSLLFMLLFALMAPWAANAQSVQIGDGTATNSYLPSYSLYNYSVPQQIYTAEEIDASGNITSIAFYNAGSEKARKYNIYMAHTTKSAFESTTDWIALTDADLVYQGAEAVAMVANAWTTFTFDTPFAYNGTDNLVIGVLDLTGSWSSGMSCRAFTAANQALYKYQDAGAYGIDGTYNGTVQTGSIAATKSQIVLGGIQQAHPAPTGLTATPHPTTADLSWTENGTATQWEVAYKLSTAEEFTTVVVNTNPYTLTGLTGETAYNVKVRAYYSETAQSQWSAVVNFTTQPACPAPTALASSNLTASSATLTWTAGYEESDWVLQYGTSYSFTEGTYTEVTVNGTPTYEVTGLSEFTTYYAHVKADCGGDSQSEWSTMLTFTTKEICPEGKICIGDGTATSSYVPANNYYNYSLTQQIYTAAEIGEAGAILSIDFFKASTVSMVVDLDIYMVSTTKDEFASATDFVPVTANDLVFSGTVTFADNAWTTIELDAPFIYDGTSNVAIMVDNNTGDYESTTYFYVYNSDKNQALYAYDDGTNYDPFAPAFSYRTATKNRIRLAIGEPPACPKPMGLAVDYQGGTEATIRWTSDAEAWNMRVNGTEINGTITNPYTLTGLEMATTYNVEVQANCGSSTSEWAGPVSFTTDLCLPEDMCTLTFELTDSYGDTWNGNAIQVVDALTGAVIGEVTNTTNDHANAPITDIVTLSVCDGRAINFVWVSGNYASETSYVVYDVNGAEILSGAEGSGMITDYTVNCTVNPCLMPAIAEVEEAAESATVTITGGTETYNIRYRTPRGFNYGFEQADPWVVDSFDPCTTYDGDQTRCYGFDGETFTNIPFTGSTIAFQSSGTNLVAHTGNAFGLMVSAIPSYYPEGVTHSDDWFILPELTIERGSVFSFWGREITTSYGAETINVGIYGSTDGTFASLLEGGEEISVNSTTWTKYTFDLSEYAGQTIRLAINYVSDDIFGFMFDDIFVGNPENDTWDVVVENVTSPYEITGLIENTDYELQVQPVCGEEEVGEWSNSVIFHTLHLCEAPTNVVVSEVTTNSAVVTWESEATSFDIEVNGDVTEDVTSPYTLNDLDPGTAYSVRVRANCGETGYSNWTNVITFATDCEAYDLPYEYGIDEDLGADLDCWFIYSFNEENYPDLYYEDETHTNIVFSFVATEAIGEDEYADQLLISPELNTNGSDLAVEFQYMNPLPDYVQYFEVGYTSGDRFDLSTYEWTDTYTVESNEWATFSETFPAGTKYVCIYYMTESGGYLFLDNFSFTEAAEGQTIELTAGWNWISTYIDLNEVNGIELLKEALGDYATMIQTYSESADYFGDGEWAGLEDYEWTNGEMIMVEVVEDCTITLAGPTVDPSTVEIEIYPEWNWIGFPVATETPIEVALAGFEPEDEDAIQGYAGTSDYMDEWLGEIMTLVPGQGYMYLSNSTEQKTLVFQTGDSKARRIIAKPIELKNRAKKTGDGMTKSATTISIKQIKK